jgi:hypothetical protein
MAARKPPKDQLVPYTDQLRSDFDVDPEGPRDEAWRERQAFAEADGRSDYSAADLMAAHEAKVPYAGLDVIELGYRGAEFDQVEPADVDEGPTEDEAAQARAEADEAAALAQTEQEDEARKQALLAERDRLDAELKDEGWVK